MAKRTKTYVTIQPDGKVEKHEAAWELRDLQKNVGGGYIEAIKVKILGKKYSAWANEEGLLKGFPVNSKATLYRAAYYSINKEDPHYKSCTVVGPIIVENFKGDEKLI
tara:strand:- start:136 stop:459 length:324 start_codon:yes stop_codon:yes gene_type:complete